MSTEIFSSKRLLCRRWLPQDLRPLYEVYSDADAMRWVGDGMPITLEECGRWLEVTADNYEKRGYGMFTLLDATNGHVVGFAGLVHPGGQTETEIKYAFHRRYWGQGLASESVPELLGYGHAQHGLTRIVATVHPENLASQRVLAKSGMHLAELRTNDDGTNTLVFEWLASDSAG